MTKEFKNNITLITSMSDEKAETIYKIFRNPSDYFELIDILTMLGYTQIDKKQCSLIAKTYRLNKVEITVDYDPYPEDFNRWH